MQRPRSARELADCAGLPADRLYYHLGQLEQAGLIEVAEYRRLPRHPPPQKQRSESHRASNSVRGDHHPGECRGGRHMSRRHRRGQASG